MSNVEMTLDDLMALIKLLGKERVLATRLKAMKERKVEMLEMNGQLLGGGVSITLVFDGRPKHQVPSPRDLLDFPRIF